MSSFRISVTIQASSVELYEALTTLRGLENWWTQQVELYPHIGGTATFRFGKDAYAVMKISKLVPEKEVIWKCVEHHFPLKGSEIADEWVGTKIKFSITPHPQGGSLLLFTHEGIYPDLACYKDTEEGWNRFMKSLQQYLETGKGTPHK